MEDFVYAQFIIQTDESIVEAKILKPQMEKILPEEEAPRLINSMHASNPGMIPSKTEPVMMKLPLHFTLK